MNILFLSTWFPTPADNGSKLRVYHLLRSLSRAHQVTLLSFAFDTAQPEEPGPLRHWCAHIETLAIDPFAVNRAGALAPFSRRRRWCPGRPGHEPAGGPVSADSSLRRRHRLHRDDGRLRAPGAARHSQDPGRTQLPDPLDAGALRRADAAALQRLRCWASWQKTRRYEARLFRRFDLVTMVSEQDRAVCLADLPGYRGPVEVVPNGVDCEHNRPGLAQPQPDALVFNGSLTYSANYDAMRWFLAEVYPRIKAQVPGVSLTITGSTHGVDLAGLALDDTVRLTGFVDDVRIPVAEAGVCVVPIRQGGGTRLKILEAMALGTPVVATSKGAEGLDVADGEHLLLADDPEAFARRTVELLGNPALRHDLAANARRLVEDRYDWAAIGQRFVDLVEATVKEKIQRTA